MLEDKAMADNFVVELAGKEFDSFIKKGIVLVDFYAEWCMPCLMMTPIIEELAEKYKGRIKIGKVNIDGERELTNKYGIRSIPHFILFKNGEVVKEFNGSMSSEDFDEKLRKLV